MSPLTAYLANHWLSLVLFLPGLVLLALGLLRRARGQPHAAATGAGAVLACLGLGGLLLDNPATADYAPWVAFGSLAMLMALLAVLLLSTLWWNSAGYAALALLVIGLGGTFVGPLQRGLRETARTALSLEPAKPWWLFLLLLIPVVIWLSFRSLAGLGPVRRWVAIGLRCALVAFLALALSEMRLRHDNETTTVLFVVDRSLSIPQEPYTDPSNPDRPLDRRWDRVKKFLNEAVEQRPHGRERDKSGLIVFGRRPRLELPPSDAPRFQLGEVTSTVDGNTTDIAAALKLALASFPEGSAKRIVLITDGNENLGSAEEQARLAKLNGAQIDVVPLAAGERNESEVLVQGVEAPPVAELGSQLPIRVLIRSHNPNSVAGTLTLRQQTEGQSSLVEPPRKVIIPPGLTSFTFKQPLTGKQESYTYEAEFVPEGVVGPNERLLPIGNDRPQNNRATTHVVARGSRRVLLVEPVKNQHANLVRELRSRKVDITPVLAEVLPKDKDKLGVTLSNFDCVILANLPAETLTDEQQEMIRSNTHEQGCGLVMIGGPDGFGAGGWQNTPVEKALPVDSEIKALKVQGKGGLVLIMHACEMAQGNFWEKKIGKLAIEKLSSNDEVGVLYYDWGKHIWHIPLQEIGDKRSWMMSQVDKMSPGDMPDFDGPLQMAHKELTDPKRELATKHVILISDGDPALTNQQLLADMRRDKVTVTTIGVATHGAPQAQALANIAQATRGRFHNVTSPNMLPAIYIKETRLVSQSFVYERRFQPKVNFRAGPTERLPDPPPLYGFVRTTPKSSPLVELPIETPPFAEQKFPILAYWYYGLGKSVAFTSDARSDRDRRAWDRDWADSEMFIKFWEQVIDWSLRPTESKNLALVTEVREGKVRVLVDARDEQNRPLVNLNLRGAVTTPSGKEGLELRFEQKNSGVYEAEFKADESGSYFVNVQPTRRIKRTNAQGREIEVDEAMDGVRAGVTVPYSPEYADLESNTALLANLARITGGSVYLEKPRAVVDGKEVPSPELVPAGTPTLDEVVRSGLAFRPGLATYKNLQPVWHWLLFLTGTLLLFDVAVRRIAVDPSEAATAAVAFWDHLRGRAPQAVAVPEYFDRLKSRKAQVGEAIGQGKAARRFEGAGTGATAAPPPGADQAAAAPEPASRAPRPRPVEAAGAGAAEGGDYLSRLKKAKQQAMQDKERKDDAR